MSIDTTTPAGLKGVEVTETRISDVKGAEGFFHYRQYPAPALAQTHTYDEVAALLIDSELPADGGAAMRAELAAARRLPDGLAVEALVGLGPIDALRTGLSLVGAMSGADPLWDCPADERRRRLVRLSGAAPALIAAVEAARRGSPPTALDDPTLGTAAALMRGLGLGDDPDRVRALERYLILTADHGLNASTFTARVVASTGSDAASCLVAAVGALAGPLHGGAPSLVLDLLDQVGEPGRAESVLAAELAAGRRLMGFGHAVYRTEDPRADALRAEARRLGAPRVALAERVEEVGLALLAQRQPQRPLRTNVEFWAAVVLEAVGIPRSLFTPVFATARLAGWSANVLEQLSEGVLFRPSARYVGPEPI